MKQTNISQSGTLTSALQVLDGDRVEQVGDRQSGREILTKVANQSIVLLKNEGGVLPLKPQVRERYWFHSTS